MILRSRRAVIASLLAVSLTALAGCSERAVVVGPGATGSRSKVKNREENEAKYARRARPRR